MYIIGKLRKDFLRLCRRFIDLAEKYGRNDTSSNPNRSILWKYTMSRFKRTVIFTNIYAR